MTVFLAIAASVLVDDPARADCRRTPHGYPAGPGWWIGVPLAGGAALILWVLT